MKKDDERISYLCSMSRIFFFRDFEFNCNFFVDNGKIIA